VDSWLKHAGITQGPMLRGFWRGGRVVRPHALTVVAVEHIVGAYPVVIEGEKRIVKPHDLRRTYARLAWEAGMQPVAIQQNLGHTSLDTTLIYIGDLDTSHRQPGAFLVFNLGSLPRDPLVD
jgi:integrase